jgi:MFS family permease
MGRRDEEVGRRLRASFKGKVPFSNAMDRRAFIGLMIINLMLAFGNTFAASFNMIYLIKHLGLELWQAPTYMLIGFSISILVSLWMSWKPSLDPRNAIIAGLGFLIFEFTLFAFVTDGIILSLIVGCAFGLFYPLFWTPCNILMAHLTEKGDRGVTYGAFFFIWPLATFIAPFIGGLVIGYVSYQALYVLGIVILLLTGVVVAAYRNYIPKNQVMKIRLDAIGKRNVIAVLGEGGFEGVFWIDVILITYIFSQDEVQIGAVFSLFGLAAGLMGIIQGKVSDKIQNRRFFSSLSAIASIPCVILIYLSTSLESFAFANGLLEFACFVFPVFIFAILTDRLEETKNDSVLGREFLLDIGRVSSIAILMALLAMGFSPQQVMLLAIPFLLMGTFAHEEKRKASKSVRAGDANELH